VEYLNKALAIFLSVGEDHPDVKDTYQGIADVYEAQGELEKAREVRKKHNITTGVDSQWGMAFKVIVIAIFIGYFP
jgi:hypothetical protein